MNSFEIRTYGRTELAQLYCPDLYPGLRAGLSTLGLSPRSRSYTPAQVSLIVGALGEP